jgi:hypothetical protein
VSAREEITPPPRIKNYIRIGWSIESFAPSAINILRTRKFVRQIVEQLADVSKK